MCDEVSYSQLTISYFMSETLTVFHASHKTIPLMAKKGMYVRTLLV